MANLRDIRNRIRSVENTKQITRAMKMVAAAKLRRAQERIFNSRPYAFKIHQLTQHVREHLDPSRHELFQAREDVNGVLLVVITSDRGLCGAFNSNITELTHKTIEEEYQKLFDRDDGYLLCLGKKGHEHFARREHTIRGDHRGFFDELKFNQVSLLVDEIVDEYRRGRWDEVKIIYNEFRNTISQDQIVEPFLPISEERFLTPAMETDLEERVRLHPDQSVNYLAEPDVQTLLDELVPRYLRFRLWRAVLESNAAEQGARMAAMDNATNNASEMLDELELTYNRARQAAITTEIIEIASGAEALSGDEGY